MVEELPLDFVVDKLYIKYSVALLQMLCCNQIHVNSHGFPASLSEEEKKCKLDDIIFSFVAFFGVYEK